MKLKHQYVDGYRIPTGIGGVTIRRACEIILENPGIKQGDLLDQATKFSGLYSGTASWITSPGEKSPAGILWDRVKVGRGFTCIPNKNTPLVGEASKHAFEIVISEARKMVANLGPAIKPGVLIRYEPISEYYNYNPMTGVYLGVGYCGRIFSSVEELEADPGAFVPLAGVHCMVLPSSGEPESIPSSFVRPA